MYICVCVSVRLCAYSCICRRLRSACVYECVYTCVRAKARASACAHRSALKTLRRQIKILIDGPEMSSTPHTRSCSVVRAIQVLPPLQLMANTYGCLRKQVKFLSLADGTDLSVGQIGLLACRAKSPSTFNTTSLQQLRSFSETPEFAGGILDERDLRKAFD